MKGRFLQDSNTSFVEGNIYADKSSVILDWLLREGIERETFSLREVVKDRNVSLGLVQKVFRTLVLNGILQTEGVRTAKKFVLKKPRLLLESWLDHYTIVKKCRMWTYRSGLQGKNEVLEVLKKSGLDQTVVFALHSAAEAKGYKNTNLDTLELYMLDPSIRLKLEKSLLLEPQERGYEVLLIEPYYKTLLTQNKGCGAAPSLLTFLDLYHFPLRGKEQADFIAERAPELQRILKRG